MCDFFFGDEVVRTGQRQRKPSSQPVIPSFSQRNTCISHAEGTWKYKQPKAVFTWSRAPEFPGGKDRKCVIRQVWVTQAKSSTFNPDSIPEAPGECMWAEAGTGREEWGQMSARVFKHCQPGPTHWSGQMLIVKRLLGWLKKPATVEKSLPFEKNFGRRTCTCNLLSYCF